MLTSALRSDSKVARHAWPARCLSQQRSHSFLGREDGADVSASRTQETVTCEREAFGRQEGKRKKKKAREGWKGWRRRPMTLSSLSPWVCAGLGCCASEIDKLGRGRLLFPAWRARASTVCCCGLCWCTSPVVLTRVCAWPQVSACLTGCLTFTNFGCQTVGCVARSETLRGLEHREFCGCFCVLGLKAPCCRGFCLHCAEMEKQRLRINKWRALAPLTHQERLHVQPFLEWKILLFLKCLNEGISRLGFDGLSFGAPPPRAKHGFWFRMFHLAGRLLASISVCSTCGWGALGGFQFQRSVPRPRLPNRLGRTSPVDMSDELTQILNSFTKL